MFSSVQRKCIRKHDTLQAGSVAGRLLSLAPATGDGVRRNRLTWNFSIEEEGSNLKS
jgi:hypothetical protein